MEWKATSVLKITTLLQELYPTEPAWLDAGGKIFVVLWMWSHLTSELWDDLLSTEFEGRKKGSFTGNVHNFGGTWHIGTNETAFYGWSGLRRSCCQFLLVVPCLEAVLSWAAHLSLTSSPFPSGQSQWGCSEQPAAVDAECSCNYSGWHS